MKRDLQELESNEYDVLVVGAGMFGAATAWECAQRGLKVALIEKDDFCSATSANHFKMIHGGIRYLQHLDFARVRESCNERSCLLRIAPHLCKPAPILMPTYGHGMKGKEVLWAGVLLYGAVTFDRNFMIQDPARKVPLGYRMSRKEVLERFPGLDRPDLTGGAVFYDGQIHNPPRLVLSFVSSAVSAGASVANYTEAFEFIREGDKVAGVKARCQLSKSEISIRAKLVINTAGPWAQRLLDQGGSLGLKPAPTFSRDLAFVIDRPLDPELGLACPLKSSDADALLDRGGRHVFLMPWRGKTLVGVWHKVYDKAPDSLEVPESDLQGYVDEANEAYPALDLKLEEISYVNTGLILFGDESAQGKGEISFGKRSLLVDHRESHNTAGLISLIGVRATTARGMAEKAVDMAYTQLEGRAPASKTAQLPLHGGDFPSFEDLVLECQKALEEAGLKDRASEFARSIAHNFGSQWPKLLKLATENSEFLKPLPGTLTLQAEVVFAVRSEMAQRLRDVMIRRTDVGTIGFPGKEAMEVCADIMATECQWSPEQKQEELNDAKKVFASLGPWDTDFERSYS